jgi:hypothetical protein
LDASFAARATQRHIDTRFSGSGNANTSDLVSGNCEEIRITVTTASHTPDGSCATGRPNDGACDGADGERGGAAVGSNGFAAILASELNGSPAASAPSFARAFSEPIVSLISANKNGFDTLMIENS